MKLYRFLGYFGAHGSGRQGSTGCVMFFVCVNVIESMRRVAHEPVPGILKVGGGECGSGVLYARGVASDMACDTHSIHFLILLALCVRMAT